MTLHVVMEHRLALGHCGLQHHLFPQLHAAEAPRLDNVGWAPHPKSGRDGRELGNVGWYPVVRTGGEPGVPGTSATPAEMPPDAQKRKRESFSSVMLAVGQGED